MKLATVKLAFRAVSLRQSGKGSFFTSFFQSNPLFPSRETPGLNDMGQLCKTVKIKLVVFLILNKTAELS